MSRNLKLVLASAALIIASVVGAPVPAGSTGQPTPTTVTVDGVTYTAAQLEGWNAAVKRHTLARLGTLKKNIQGLPVRTLDSYLPEVRALAVRVDRGTAVSPTTLDRINHIEAKYEATLRTIWANIARLAAWHRAQQAAAYPSGLCGGDLPPCYVMRRESGGNITAQNPSSTASGKWQFLDSTWAGYGGYAKARYAPEKTQDAKARQLWAGGRGCSHWSAC